MPDERNLETEAVDLSSIPRRSGLTFYASTSLEQNTKGLNAKSTAFVTYNVPEGRSIEVEMLRFTQIHQQVLADAHKRAMERKLAHETNSTDPIEQFEIDLITGEITE